VGSAIDTARLKRAERVAPPPPGRPPRFLRLRSLFGGAAGRAAPGSERAPDEQRLTSLTDDLARWPASRPAPSRHWSRSRWAPGCDAWCCGGSAIDHLIVNALYSPPGSAVTVSPERAGDEIHFRADDEGPGVAHAERDRVFERFFRGRAAVAADVPGNGLGLAIVAEVAAVHGGRTWCEPGPAGGARFVLALPAG
jgi:hypothetical protein